MVWSLVAVSVALSSLPFSPPPCHGEGVEQVTPIQVVVWTMKGCVPCKRAKPHLEKMAKSGKYQFLFLDFRSNKKLADKYKVKTVPTYFVVSDGKIALRTSNLHTLQTYNPDAPVKKNNKQELWQYGILKSTAPSN